MESDGWKILYLGDYSLLSGWLKRVFEHSDLFVAVETISEAKELLDRQPIDLLVIELGKFRSGSDTGLINFARQRNPNIDIICIKSLDSRKEAPESERLLMGIYWNSSKLDELVQADTFWGVTHASDFFSLLQAVALTGKSVMLSIHSGEIYGVIFIENGVVVHAETETLEGKDAFFTLASLSGGLFYVEEDVLAEKKTIDEPLDSLLIEAVSRKEEIEQPFYALLKNIMLHMPTGVFWGAVVSKDGQRILGAVGEGAKGPVIKSVIKIAQTVSEFIGEVKKATFEFENYHVAMECIDNNLYVMMAFRGNPALVEFVLSKFVSTYSPLS